MQRYFIPQSQFNDNNVELTGDDAKHIARVMRMKPGDEIICCDEEGHAFICHIQLIEDHRVVAIIHEQIEKNNELPVKVTIAQGLPKGDKLDMIVQKATELGVDSIYPFQAERSIVKWTGTSKIERKQERLQKIAKEAAEQSHRNRVPEIKTPLDLKALLKESELYHHKVVAYEEEAKRGAWSGLSSVFQTMKPDESLLVVIGPEGGLSEEEVSAFDQAGFVRCALGKRILRTETAPLYLLAAVSYYFELEKGVNNS